MIFIRAKENIAHRYENKQYSKFCWNSQRVKRKKVEAA